METGESQALLKDTRQKILHSVINSLNVRTVNIYTEYIYSVCISSPSFLNLARLSVDGRMQGDRQQAQVEIRKDGVY